MKELTFSTLERYEVLYEAISVAECGYKGGNIRLVNRIFEKLEAIGKPKEQGYTLNFNYSNKENGTVYEYPSISLEDTEFDLLITAFDSVTWTASGARKVNQVYEWLHSLK